MSAAQDVVHFSSDIFADSTNVCEPCKESGKSIMAEYYCEDCKENLCMHCKETHTLLKITKNHKPIPMNKKQTDIQVCEPCNISGNIIIAEYYCQDCDENLCKECLRTHATLKATKTHKPLAINEKQKAEPMCEPCGERKIPQRAVTFCEDCKEYFCKECTATHSKMKATRDHVPTEVGLELHAPKLDISTRFCEPCSDSGKKSTAVKLCEVCEELLCEDCTNIHLQSKATKDHNPVALSMQTTQKSNVSEEEGIDAEQPGKPALEELRADSITISWDPPEKFKKGNFYHVSYKKVHGGTWKIVPNEFKTATAEICNIPSETEFVFRVRMVNDKGEGPYSPTSGVCRTAKSPASRIVSFAILKEKGNPSPSIYTLPLTEVKDGRNLRAKSKKFEIGNSSVVVNKERTIMLVGATGTGKSTLVDGLVNYVLGVNWSDRFRFTVLDLEQEEKDRLKNQALSQTEWITCYTLNPEQGSRLNYRLNIIDTPGFGDSRGLARDQEIVEQIRQLFSEKDSKGIACIDAVCFLIKAPDARLTAVQTYIFQSIMSLFGKDIEKNICSLITFADGIHTAVIAALDESKLPFGHKFTFNNSGLFAKNVEIDQFSLSPMFWNMGLQSFKLFFDHLDTMETKSLQLTKTVLDERFRLEATVRNLQPQLNAGLSKVDQMKQEINILEQHKAQIAANANFEYEVDHTQQYKKSLPSGTYTTNCTPCTFTCHENCVYADNNQKANCCTMGLDGYCTVCPKRCHWTFHANTPYIFEYKTTKVKKTYADMQKKYQEASGKLPTQDQLIKRMTAELNQLCDDVENMMEIIKECSEKLKSIALRPNPLSLIEHIDMMIKAEEMEKKTDFQKRIQVLEEFKQRAKISVSATSFTKDPKQREKSATDVTSVMSRMKAWFD